MATSRTHTSTHTGPITLHADLPAGSITVHVEDRPTAEVTITTTDDTGPSADAVTGATLADTPDGIRAAVTATVGGGGVVQQVTYGRDGGVTITQSAGTVTGTFIGAVIGSIGRDTVIGGVRVGGGGGGGTQPAGGAPITIVARLPHGSSLDATTTTADVTATGPLHRAQVRTVSGDVSLDGVADLDVTTTSGDVRVDALAGQGHASSGSGGIHVRAVQPSTLTARTVSGDIRVAGERVALTARTVSGRVSQR